MEAELEGVRWAKHWRGPAETNGDETQGVGGRGRGGVAGPELRHFENSGATHAHFRSER